MSVVPPFLQESSTIRRSKMAKKSMTKKDAEAGLTTKQKKLPPALQKMIMKKKGAK